MSISDNSDKLDVDQDSEYYVEIQSLFRSRAKIELQTIDIAVLLLLKKDKLKNRLGGIFYTQNQLKRMYRDIELLTSPQAENESEISFTSCLKRLIKTNCLMRSDSLDYSNEDPEFIVTGFGDTIASYYTDNAKLDASSLVAIFEVFNAELIRVKKKM